MAASQPDAPRLRIVFFGTAEFACPTLVALEQEESSEVLGVVTQPDRPQGRTLRFRPSAVKETARSLGLTVWQPERCREEGFAARLRELKADLFVVAAYGQILPQMLLDIPPLGAINVHASLLPKYRGAAPIQWAIANGDAETGVTIMRMEAGLDTGPMVAAEAIPIWDDDDAQTLHDRLATLGADLLSRTLPGYQSGDIRPVKQDESLASYARKVEKQDGRIQWRHPANVVSRRLRAFTPWPGAFALLPGAGRRRLKVLSAEPVARDDGEPGEILRADQDSFLVSCGEGALQLLDVQREGGRRMSSGEFLKGYPMEPGLRLG